MVLPVPAINREAEKKEDAPIPDPPIPIPKAPVPDADNDDPSINYLDAGFGDNCTCPVCMGDGVGRLCYGYCDNAGNMVGRFPHCEEVGRLGDDCPECPNMTFETQMEMGECPNCGRWETSTLNVRCARTSRAFSSKTILQRRTEKQ
jgi:hypothetical protein